MILIILLLLFAVSWIFDKVINAVIILMSYGATRWVFPITYHAKTDRGCIMFTIACFTIAIIIAVPINLSIISPIFIKFHLSFWIKIGLNSLSFLIANPLFH